MKKILLTGTGGTIASVQGPEGLTPVLGPDDIIRYLPKATMGHYNIHCLPLMQLDSVNIQPRHWQVLAETIREHYESYDGFVITHGTDTMAYTSAALTYMLQGIGKPVVLTGSQIPIRFDGTDAIRNATDALRFASEPVSGVYVVFNGKAILGTRAVKLRSKSLNAFESVNHPYIAAVENGVVHYLSAVNPGHHEQWKLDVGFCTGVFLLKLFPGLGPQIFDLIRHRYKGVVIESFGNGGVPSRSHPDLIKPLAELLDDGVAIVLTTQCLEEGQDWNLYETGKRLDKKRLIDGGDMITEALVAKLMWALGKTDNLYEVKKLVETPIAGDRSGGTFRF
ncbi:asparaginase [Paenibacillus hamazuiensis]|uniref:asparaginase n=1 Tax=Paenibacillus hamazuiensis TaxID=2936508 RepID=UPI00200D96F5|nr:asparaginase [Paenibacillus hamazuiensis]